MNKKTFRSLLKDVSWPNLYFVRNYLHQGHSVEAGFDRTRVTDYIWTSFYRCAGLVS
jgi:hypothetical protein